MTQDELSELQLKALNYAYWHKGEIPVGGRSPVHKSIAVSLVRLGLLTFRTHAGKAGQIERYVLTLRGSQLVLIGKMLWRTRV